MRRVRRIIFPNVQFESKRPTGTRSTCARSNDTYPGKFIPMIPNSFPPPAAFIVRAATAKGQSLISVRNPYYFCSSLDPFDARKTRGFCADHLSIGRVVAESTSICLLLNPIGQTLAPVLYVLFLSPLYVQGVVLHLCRAINP